MECSVSNFPPEYRTLNPTNAWNTFTYTSQVYETCTFISTATFDRIYHWHSSGIKYPSKYLEICSVLQHVQA